MRGTSTKINSEYYIPTISLDNIEGQYDPANILLCQYNILDVAIHIAVNSPSSKILVHNFANNEQPCGGYWEGITQENEIYARTNLQQLIMPIKHKLYPIQEQYSPNGDIDKSVNIIITENCKIISTADGKIVSQPIYVDIASIDAVVSPQEKNLEMYSTNKFQKFDYSNQLEADQMEARIHFLLDIAIGEGYDYLLTGAWGINEMNPHWGLINLWNTKIKSMIQSKLHILFCIPIDPTNEESVFTYQYFNRYLLGQENALKYDKVKQEHDTNRIIEKMSKDEYIIKRKIYGLIWGIAFAEVISTYCRSSMPEQQTDYWIITQSEYTLDWDICTDRAILLARSLSESKLDIIPTVVAAKLVKWKTIGFEELQERQLMCQDKMLKHILSLPNYSESPIYMARSAYMNKGSNDMSYIAIGGNALNGIFKDYSRRSLIYCQIMQPDTACQASCLVHSYILNSIWNGRYITTQDWGKLVAECNKIFDTDPHTNTQHRILFDTYWSIGRNYQYQINNGIKDYIKLHLTPNQFRPATHTFLPMTLAIIMMYDIQGHIYVKNKQIKTMMNITDIPMIDDHMRDQKINYESILDADYYFQIIETLSTINADATCMAIVGSIVGLACWNKVYNNEVMRDTYGNQIDTTSMQWIKYVENAEWLNNELDIFVDKYIEERRKILLSRQNNGDYSAEIRTAPAPTTTASERVSPVY